MSVTVGIGQSIDIDLVSAVFDVGWTKDGDLAIHEACNQGDIFNDSMPIVDGISYRVTYEVVSRTSGQVYPHIGANNGTSRTSIGVYSDDIIADGTQLAFYSDGNLSIRVLLVEESESSQPYTICFDDYGNKFLSKFEFAPDVFGSDGQTMLWFKNGSLYTNETNETRGNFFGINYPAKIKIAYNQNPLATKEYFSMREQSSSCWIASNITIEPYEGKPNGMQSRLKSNRFKRYQGDYFADFLRNLLDPRFLSEDEALFKGEWLVGKVIYIELTNDRTTEENIFQIDVHYTESPYTY